MWRGGTALVAVMLIAGCAHPRRPLASVAVRAGALLPKLGIGHSPTAPDKVNASRKPLKAALPSSGSNADRITTLLGGGEEHPISTTGKAPPPSSGASSVVITSTPRPPASNPTTHPELEPATDEIHGASPRDKVRVLLIACALIAAIVWLPRQLDARRHWK
jgi:hypothetical protein